MAAQKESLEVRHGWGWDPHGAVAGWSGRGGTACGLGFAIRSTRRDFLLLRWKWFDEGVAMVLWILMRRWLEEELRQRYLGTGYGWAAEAEHTALDLIGGSGDAVADLVVVMS
ncbi:hypothetical protein M0R45_024759 [Rubus argutus]|uniref:Uncharacterized protein n=1 Tax=Rubus argutus TaxID=59490 RepID=A0AAW1WU62_RUBAR